MGCCWMMAMMMVARWLMGANYSPLVSWRRVQMVSTDITHTNFDRIRSNHGANNVVKQHRFLTNLLEKLKNEAQPLSFVRLSS